MAIYLLRTYIKSYEGMNTISTTPLEQDYNCSSDVSKNKKIYIDKLRDDLDQLYYLCIYFSSTNGV